MLSASDIEKTFDFKTAGIDGLELRGYVRITPRAEGIQRIILEEVPAKRPIVTDAKETPYYIWTPWTYYIVDVSGFDTPYWSMGGSCLVERTTQLEDKKDFTFRAANHFNLSPGHTMCYPPAISTLEQRNTEPCAVVAREVNAWWMGQPNMDYGINDFRALQYEIYNNRGGVDESAREWIDPECNCGDCGDGYWDYYGGDPFDPFFTAWESMDLEEVNKYVEQSGKINAADFYITANLITVIKPTMANSNNKKRAKALAQEAAAAKKAKKPVAKKKITKAKSQKAA